MPGQGNKGQIPYYLFCKGYLFQNERDLSIMTFQSRLQSHALMTADYFEKRFAEKLDAPEHLHDAIKYAVLNGGKRFRPFLVLESAHLFDVAFESALPTAAALECIHCYSLVHDDLPAMDDDDLRRGRPTVHIAFDEATAILAGDSLLTYAFEILSEETTHSHPSVRAELIIRLAKASGSNGMAGGQARDLKAEQESELSFEEIGRIQSMKTGALITYACEAGAILGEADTLQTKALITYGEKIGRAFQIADDLLDIEGDPGKVGKATSKDSDAGKATFVSHLGIDGAKRALANLRDEAINSLSCFGEKAETLIEAAHFVTQRDH